MRFTSTSGIEIRLDNFFITNKGVVFVGRIISFGNSNQEMLTDEFSKIMNGEKLFGRKILGTEWFATSYQRIWRSNKTST
jgi:hypothetical protein